MKTFAKIGLGIFVFGFVVAVLGAIVIRTSAPRPVAQASQSASAVAAPASSAQLDAATSSKPAVAASAAAQNGAAVKN